MGKYNLDTTPLSTLLDDPEASAIFAKFAPGFADHPMLQMAKGMPMGTILTMAGGQLGADKVEQLKAELSAL